MSGGIGESVVEFVVVVVVVVVVVTDVVAGSWECCEFGSLILPVFGYACCELWRSCRLLAVGVSSGFIGIVLIGMIWTECVAFSRCVG